MQIKTLKFLFETHKESTLFGRYIHSENIAPLLENFKEKASVNEVGKSVNGLPIHTITFGSGDKKILIWSQMHGNESTTTKAVFDLLNSFFQNNDEFKYILEGCEICVIPMLNPDGAKSYTRLNANEVDLNRDAQDLSQPESVVLRAVFDDFKPDFCFNLHGQRTIYSAGESNKSATVSFLSPAQDADRMVTLNRKVAMEVISVMNDNLQEQIPNQVAIYDDGFNLNCVGDTFQAAQVPTILFEAGHYVDDYGREKTREYIYQSLVVSLSYIAIHEIKGDKYRSYFEIPQNKKLFYDIIIRNAKDGDVAIQFEERLVDGVLNFVPKIEKISDLKNYYAHKEINANDYNVYAENKLPLTIGSEIDFVIINDEKFSLKV